jgi:hypothetical protein
MNISGCFSAYHQEHKTVHTATGIVKPILLPAADNSCCLLLIATGSSIGLTIPDAVCTVL